MPVFLNENPHVAYVGNPDEATLSKVMGLTTVEADGAFADRLADTPGFVNLTELSKKDRKERVDAAEAQRAVLQGGPGPDAYPATDEESGGEQPSDDLEDAEKSALVEACEVRGLDTEGSKSVLADRLREAGLGTGAVSTEDVPPEATGRAAAQEKPATKAAVATDADPAKLDFNQLRSLAKALGLDTKGKKAALRKRIKAAQKGS
jgi:hypothetical protein